MSTRRAFLARSALLGAATVGDFAFLQNLPPLSAQQVQRSIAPVHADLEPLVRLIEDTPRNRLLEEVGTRVRNGASYQNILGAVMLAGVRGIQPRPVGFKFHAVLVVNSAHLASLAAQDRDRWLPLFWALDNFKSSQAANAQQGDWRMAALADDRLPAAETTVRNFRTAMDNWEMENADRAVAQLARIGSMNEVYEMFWRYGARDFRDIGHKAIFVANSYRTFVTIGWRHAEPILRSLAYALVDHGRDANPANSDLEADRPGRDNLRRLTRIRADWQRGRVAREAVTELLATLRTASAGDAAEAVVTKLNDRVDPSCVWDACFLMAGELLMKQPGIVGLHTLTTTNALAFGYSTTSNDETRRLLMLQAASFLPMFRQRMGNLPAAPRIDTLEPGELMGQGQAAIDDIFATASTSKLGAARKTLALLQNQREQLAPMMTTARRLIFAKGTDSHDYKFSSAALEDFYHVTPEWRNRFLAASLFWLKGSGGNDTPLLQRTRAAFCAGEEKRRNSRYEGRRAKERHFFVLRPSSLLLPFSFSKEDPSMSRVEETKVVPAKGFHGIQGVHPARQCRRHGRRRHHRGGLRQDRHLARHRYHLAADRRLHSRHLRPVQRCDCSRHRSGVAAPGSVSAQRRRFPDRRVLRLPACQSGDRDAETLYQGRAEAGRTDDAGEAVGRDPRSAQGRSRNRSPACRRDPLSEPPTPSASGVQRVYLSFAMAYRLDSPSGT